MLEVDPEAEPLTRLTRHGAGSAAVRRPQQKDAARAQRGPRRLDEAHRIGRVLDEVHHHDGIDRPDLFDALRKGNVKPRDVELLAQEANGVARDVISDDLGAL